MHQDLKQLDADLTRKCLNPAASPPSPPSPPVYQMQPPTGCMYMGWLQTRDSINAMMELRKNYKLWSGQQEEEEPKQKIKLP